MKFFVLLFLFIGCDSENIFDISKKPYSEDDNNIQLRDPRNNRDPRPPQPAFSVDDVIEYREGRSKDYVIKAVVPPPGKPIVKVYNLPDGATFDESSLTLSWRPSYEAGNDLKDPTVGFKRYTIRVTFRSSEDDEVVAQTKDVELVVQNQPRGIEINSFNEESVREGSTLHYNFYINDKDYPNGPFKVHSDGLPSGAYVELVNKNNPNHYRVVYTPDHNHVKLSENDDTKEHEFKVFVTNPALNIQEKKMQINVKDVRLRSKIVVPGTFTQGLDVTVQVTAYDENKEVAPRISLENTPANFGEFSQSLSRNDDNYVSVLTLKWKDIPPRYNGRDFDLIFKACVLRRRYTYSQCSTDTTNVKIVVRERNAPIISRSNWSVDELVYIDFDKSFTRSVNVRDAQDYRGYPRVEILPVSMRKYVSWSNNQIRIRMDKAGVHQFFLKATNDYNISSSESFIFEVFKKDRAKTLYFADTTRDKEATFYKNKMGAIDIMNPFIQAINLRNLSGRENLVLGSSILYDREANAVIERAMREIDNVIIASPLIQNMPDSFLDSLKSKYNYSIIGRYNDLPNQDDLSKNYFVTTSDFRAPQNPIMLSQNTTAHSSNPLIFNGGLDEPNKKCKGVLGLTSTGYTPLVLGAVCERGYSSKLILLGTEWADLKTSENDINIPTQWFNTMLKGSF